MDKISVTVVGDNRVDLVHRLRAFADNLDGSPAEATTGKVVSKTAPAKKAASKAAAPVVDDGDEDDGFAEDTGETNGFDSDESEEGFDEAPPEKKAAPKKGTNGKAKKITLDDVNDACKAHAQAKGRPATLAVLQKHFKTQSVTALKPEQYETCISAMAVN